MKDQYPLSLQNLSNSLNKEIGRNVERIKATFLIRFTKELIKNSGTGYFYKLERLVKDKDNQIFESLKKRIPEEKKIFQFNKEEIPSTNIRPLRNISQATPIQVFPIKRFSINVNEKPKHIQKIKSIPISPIESLFIPEPKLTPQFAYLKPVPTETYIELGKLNQLINDPQIKIIECHKEDENLIVKGTFGIKKVNITLSKEDIEETIKKFSEEAKIPVEEGVFRVAVGRLVLLAIISDVINTKFIIRKISPMPPPMNYQMFPR